MMPYELALEFIVDGTPRPGGSKLGFVNRKTGSVIMTDAGGEKTKNWRSDVRDAAQKSMPGSFALLDGPIYLDVTFWTKRPKCHFGTGRNSESLKPTAPIWNVGRPDATKLLRSLEDALTGLVWNDDAQVCRQYAKKMYHWKSGAWVKVYRIT